MKRFDINDYKGNYVMSIKTKKEYDIFTKYLNSVKKTWKDGTTYLQDGAWLEMEEYLAIDFNNGIAFIIIERDKKNYNILSMSDFDWSGKNEMLKVGDKVKLNISINEIIGQVESSMIGFLKRQDTFTVGRISVNNTALQFVSDPFYFKYKAEWFKKIEKKEEHKVFTCNLKEKNMNKYRVNFPADFDEEHSYTGTFDSFEDAINAINEHAYNFGGDGYPLDASSYHLYKGIELKLTNKLVPITIGVEGENNEL